MFKKYSSIENSYREKEIERIKNHGFDKCCQWVVLEKCHGTNFSFIIDKNEEVKVAKRSSILNENEIEKFYDAKKMLDKYKNNVIQLFQDLKKTNNNIKSIQIFGEHFGGLYNNKTEKGYTKIQKEVQYIPFTDFIVFDIYLIEYDNDKIIEISSFLEWDKVKDLAQKYNFKLVPELYRGSFEECLNYKNDYITKIPKLYNLENLENNIAEGNVLKPLENKYFNNGERVILKNKNDKFKEKGKIKKIKTNQPLTDKQKEWIQEISKYLELNRLSNVFSKGEVKKEWKQFNKIVGLFIKDTLDDFIKDNPNYLELDKKEQKIIKQEIGKLAQEIIRNTLKKEI